MVMRTSPQQETWYNRPIPPLRFRALLLGRRKMADIATVIVTPHQQKPTSSGTQLRTGYDKWFEYLIRSGQTADLENIASHQHIFQSTRSAPICNTRDLFITAFSFFHWIVRSRMSLSCHRTPVHAYQTYREYFDSPFANELSSMQFVTAGALFNQNKLPSAFFVSLPADR